MISLNGKILSNEHATVSPLAPGLMFGAGVFTTVRVRAGRPDFLALHGERLRCDAAALALPPPALAGDLRERCDAFLSATTLVDGAVKIMWFTDEGGQTVEVISARSQPYDAEARARGFRLRSMTCGSRANRELSRHKTLNYLEHLRAKQVAVNAGFDEALWIDERGLVLEGATTNLFAVIGDEVVTPDLRFGLLPGVARRVLLTSPTMARMREAELTAKSLEDAREVFVTNSLMGVMPVRAIDDRIYPPDRNDVTRSLLAAFEREADASR